MIRANRLMTFDVSTMCLIVLVAPTVGAQGIITGGFQWSVSLASMASDSITSVLSVNEPAVPVELMSFSVE